MGGENFPVGREMVGKGDTSCRGPGWKGGQVTFVTVFFVEFWIQFLQVSQICFQIFSCVFLQISPTSCV